jgi:hypothetical protein
VSQGEVFSNYRVNNPYSSAQSFETMNPHADNLRNVSRHGRRRRRAGGRRRTGAILSVEMLLVFPVLFILLLAIIEFSLLWSGSHQVEAASATACRVATLPASDPVELEQFVRDAARQALVKPRLIAAHRVFYTPGQITGDPVIVAIQVPMRAAAPNLLALIGFNLQGRWLRAETVMRKE